jgi:hypothetical protein
MAANRPFIRALLGSCMTVLTKLRSIFYALFGSFDSAPPVRAAGIADGSVSGTAPGAADKLPVLSASDIGFAVGAAGGNIVDAAKLQYVLSCIVPPGQKPTSEQIGRAVGVLGGGLSEALTIEELLKNK